MSGLDGDIYDRFHTCIHCGLCLPQCPTYTELGDENDSPRGRLVLMKGLADGRVGLSRRVAYHLDACLDCRACETACPSGVQYGQLIEVVRTEVAPPQRRGGLFDWLIYDVLPYPHRLRQAVRLGRLAQTLGLDDFLQSSGLINVLPARWSALLTMLPPLGEPPSPVPMWSRPPGPVRARVGLVLGCVGEQVFGATNRRTRDVLLANGCAVYCAPEQTCCGAIHYHGGRAEEARRLARANVEAFLEVDPPLDAVVTNVAGCGAMLKEYDRLFRAPEREARGVERFCGLVRDINEYLISLPLIPPPQRLNLRLTYHDACHLAHAQGIRGEPRQILRSIPGVELIDLPESDRCCGAAGTYNLTQPEMSAVLAERKLSNIERTGVDCVATANAGCALQLMRHARLTGRRLRVVHPVDLLARAYGFGDGEALEEVLTAGGERS